MVWPARARPVHAGRHMACYHPFVVVVICHSAPCRSLRRIDLMFFFWVHPWTRLPSTPSHYCSLLLASVLCFSLLFSTSCCCALLLATVLSLLLFSPSHYCSLLATVLSFSSLCSPSHYCALLLTTVLFSLLFSPSRYCSLLLAIVLSFSQPTVLLWFPHVISVVFGSKI